MRVKKTQRHPLAGDLYTPITPELLEALEVLHREYTTWRMVAEVCGLKTRALRRMRGDRAGVTVSMRVWDRILTATGGEWMLEDYLWFTAEDLVRLGLWRGTIVLEGEERRRFGEMGGK